MNEEKKLVIYTDGAARGNPGPGGYGAILMYGGKTKELSAGYRLTTNNRMELMAVIAALRALGAPALPARNSNGRAAPCGAIDVGSRPIARAIDVSGS